MIEVEGLPEGWKAVGMLVDPDQYNKYVGDDGFLYWEAKIKLEKIQPRRIVLEETEEKYLGCQTLHIDGTEIMIMTNKTWREVKETDIPLTNEDVNVKIGVSQRDGAEPKLSLSVDECKEAMRKLETFNVTDLSVKICGFLKENS